MITRASRYYHTLRYLRPSQVTLRVWAACKERAGLARLPAPPVSLTAGLSPAVPFLTWDPARGRGDPERGAFRFLNREADLGRPVNWQPPGLPLLWQFHLHYFQYLHALDRAAQVALCEEWVRANPPGATVGWHPYPTSLRIVNWRKAGMDTPALLASLYQQAAYLYRHVEAYHPGNHLLENARALLFAGTAFAGQGEAGRWRRRGLALFRARTPDQVLADGGDCERSPMYHALMLEAYADVLNLLPPGHPDAILFAAVVARMSDFLLSLTHPDGAIALFNDSTTEIAPPTADLLAYASAVRGRAPRAGASFADTGYFVCRAPDLALFIDGGPIGPDYLPAHAHADTFSYELSLHGHRFVTDTGVCEYAAGPMRRHARSTAAHNTICVDGVDHAECWGSFRVARRFPPERVSYACDAGSCRFEGHFGGYRALIGDGITLRRVIEGEAPARSLLVQDEVEGSGTHAVESRVHLHPDVSLSTTGRRVTLARSGATAALDILSGALTVSDGWYCPEFGARIANRVLVISARGPRPARLSYRITY
ncbi:MAG: alginate lyase family protein [Armatimonadetes bacterium]|nr:alginate lyase family protein [Armatimonadota bacterium]